MNEPKHNLDYAGPGVKSPQPLPKVIRRVTGALAVLNAIWLLAAWRINVLAGNEVTQMILAGVIASAGVAVVLEATLHYHFKLRASWFPYGVNLICLLLSSLTFA